MQRSRRDGGRARKRPGSLQAGPGNRPEGRLVFELIDVWRVVFVRLAQRCGLTCLSLYVFTSYMLSSLSIYLFTSIVRSSS